MTQTFSIPTFTKLFGDDVMRVRRLGVSRLVREAKGRMLDDRARRLRQFLDSLPVGERQPFLDRETEVFANGLSAAECGDRLENQAAVCSAAARRAKDTEEKVDAPAESLAELQRIATTRPTLPFEEGSARTKTRVEELQARLKTLPEDIRKAFQEGRPAMARAFLFEQQQGLPQAIAAEKLAPRNRLTEVLTDHVGKFIERQFRVTPTLEQARGVAEQIAKGGPLPQTLRVPGLRGPGG